MLIFDIGPAYIRSAIILDNTIDNYFLKEYLTNELQINKDKIQFISLTLNVSYAQKMLFFFKINLFRIEAFKNSYDYEVIKTIISKSNENFKTSYYCGPLNERHELLLKILFNSELIKIGHVNQLSILGLEYIAENIPDSFFDLPGQLITNLVQVGHKLNEVTEKNYISLKDKLFPILLANIIEGTSVYKVEGVNNFSRIGGTSFGMTTYWSLVSMACGYDDPEVAVKDAIRGNNELIDLSVGDIYGGTYEQFNLSSSLIASSFGKLKNVENINEVKKEDISRSLLTMFCVTSAQITAMLAQTSNINKVFILGFPFETLEFMQMIQMATNYFSGETVNAYFSDYAPYINLIGMCEQMKIEGIDII